MQYIENKIGRGMECKIIVSKASPHSKMTAQGYIRQQKKERRDRWVSYFLPAGFRVAAALTFVAAALGLLMGLALSSPSTFRFLVGT